MRAYHRVMVAGTEEPLSHEALAKLDLLALNEAEERFKGNFFHVKSRCRGSDLD